MEEKVIWAWLTSDYVLRRLPDSMTTHAVMVIELVIELAGAIPGIKIKLPVENKAL